MVGRMLMFFLNDYGESKLKKGEEKLKIKPIGGLIGVADRAEVIGFSFGRFRRQRWAFRLKS